MLADKAAHRINQPLRGLDMAADGADVRFDNAQRKFHRYYLLQDVPAFQAQREYGARPQRNAAIRGG